MLIGITGYRMSGKTTVANFLCSEYKFSKIALASPLKAMLRVMGLSDEEINGNLKEEPCALLGGQTPRYAMQTLGTDWGRKMVYENIWLDAWVKRIKDCGTGYSIVTDDVRFPNEADAIRELGGKIWRVHRPGYTTSDHESERLIHTIVPDDEIANAGDINLLYTMARNALKAPRYTNMV